MKTRIVALVALLLASLSSRPAWADLSPDPVIFDYQDHDPTTLIIAGGVLAVGVVIGGLMWARSIRAAAARRDMVNVSPDAVKAK